MATLRPAQYAVRSQSVDGRRVDSEMSGDAWDDDAFTLPVLTPDDAPADEEEPYVAPRTHTEWVEEDDGAGAGGELPVLLLSLSEMARQLGQGEAGISTLREQVLEALEADFSKRSAELLASGICWHSVRWRAAADRAEREAELGEGSTITVINYPPSIDGVSTDQLWMRVRQATAWEVVDQLKEHIMDANRDLLWKVKVCNEVEEMAEREMTLWERRRGSASKVESLESERLRTLHAIRAAQESCGGEHNVPEPCMRSMTFLLHNLEAHLGEATAEHARALEEGGDEAAEGEPSAVDLLLGMIFQSQAPVLRSRADADAYTRASPDSLAWRTTTTRDLRRMWHSTFGRLPAASKLALKHRISSSVQPGGGSGGGASAGRGSSPARRMLVPPPIPLSALPAVDRGVRNGSAGGRVEQAASSEPVPAASVADDPAPTDA